MALTHNLGYPRIGAKRELKFALERYWSGEHGRESLFETARQLRQQHWQTQAESGLDWIPVGDFSLYDQVLDTSFLLGHLPERVHGFQGHALDNYFRVARGRSVAAGAGHEHCCAVQAGEMTKWFDSNYHYIVPEFSAGSTFSANPEALLEQIREARAQGLKIKPVLIGPITYLRLGRSVDGSDVLAHLPALLRAYADLLRALREADIEWLQWDEPALVLDLNARWLQAFAESIQTLAPLAPKILLTTYFSELREALPLLCDLPLAGLHIDAVAAPQELESVHAQWPLERVLSIGIVSGRNIWKTDLNAVLDTLDPLQAARGDQLWLAPSSSLLHVPVSLASEQKLDVELKSWLAFAEEKLQELRCLKAALNQGRKAVAAELAVNAAALHSRKQSARVHKPDVQIALKEISAVRSERQAAYPERAAQQQSLLKLPAFPTTTIGSFPQTPEIRAARAAHKKGELSEARYQEAMQAEIARCIQEQKDLGLDVFVHGEAERNDMVEYFGEQLDGYAFSQNGWVQSYGSRCVKPPILFGDIQRPKAITVRWSTYAQSLVSKPMKGMLTGPVTMLNWSFVRDDQPRKDSCLQLALALREEVLDLERAGIRIIQIDEAALREGLPLRREQWQHYLDWAVQAFRITANGVHNSTQIHTHMCYSEFNDILPAIAAMDADVITIENARSDGSLLDAFEHFDYPNAIGPGVYDIHSPNQPDVQQITVTLQAAKNRIPAERLWVNPDCGLKTRKWEEVRPALRNMVSAAQALREVM